MLRRRIWPSVVGLLSILYSCFELQDAHYRYISHGDWSKCVFWVFNLITVVVVRYLHKNVDIRFPVETHRLIEMEIKHFNAFKRQNLMDCVRSIQTQNASGHEDITEHVGTYCS